MTKTNPQPAKARPLLGCIADDVTGATDLAINLAQGGMRVVQVMGVPTAETIEHAGDADAIVVALKTRSIPARDAVKRSLKSLAALRALGVERYYFKYCSTFDSTPAGNIGPVAEAIMDELGVKQTVFCPAFPRAGRTVYRGHLFVGDQLLHESGMRHHPLNPMTDANLPRVLEQQTTRPVGLLSRDETHAGPDAARARLSTMMNAGVAHAVADACDDNDLALLAEAVAGLAFLTGGSGLARFLPAAYRSHGVLTTRPTTPATPDITGRTLLLAGSCSDATQAQVRWASNKMPAWPVDVSAVLADAGPHADQLIAWSASKPEGQPLLVYSTAGPDAVSALQSEHGADAVASAIESFFGQLACRCVSEIGVRRIIVAGGETSGAVAAALGLQALRIGPEICAGVPWTQTLGIDPPLAVAFKSGNFGDDDFFGKALEMLP